MSRLPRWVSHGFYPFLWFRYKGACWGFCVYGSRGRNPLFALGWTRTNGRAVMWRRPFS